MLLFPALFNDEKLHCTPNGHIRKQIIKGLNSKKSFILQLIISNSFLLWYKHPNIACLYVDEIVSMTHKIFSKHTLDPEDV